MNKKQRIVDGQGASNINCSTVVFNFDVCRLSCFDLCDWLHHLVSFRIRTKNHRVHSHSLGTGPAVGGKGGVKWKTGERIEASGSRRAIVWEREMVASLAFFFFFFLLFLSVFLPFPLTAEPGPRLASTVTMNRKESWILENVLKFAK